MLNNKTGNSNTLANMWMGGKRGAVNLRCDLAGKIRR